MNKMKWMHYFFSQKPPSVLYTSEVSHLQVMPKFINIFPLLPIAHHNFFEGEIEFFSLIFLTVEGRYFSIRSNVSISGSKPRAGCLKKQQCLFLSNNSCLL